jgi:hypothetical protein
MTAAARAFEETLVELGIDEQQLDPEDFGRRAALLAASNLLWDQHLGPSYSTRHVRRLFKASKQAVNDRVRRGTLLAFRNEAGELVYPAFQFGPNGRPLAGLSAVIGAFKDAIETPYTIAAWLVSPEAELDGSTPIEELRRGRRELVADVARHYAARLRQ